MRLILFSCGISPFHHKEKTIQKSVSTALIHLVFFCQNDKKMQLTNAFVVKRSFETKSFVAVKDFLIKTHHPKAPFKEM